MTRALPPPGSQRLEHGDSSMTCSLVPWDSDAFGFTVGQIESLRLGEGDHNDALFSDFRRWSAGAGVQLVSCRIDHLRLDASMALEHQGFRFVEIVFRPRFGLHRLRGEAKGAFQIEPASANDLQAIGEIAATAFPTGRYALDHRLDPEGGRRRYAAWARQGAAAPGQSLLKVVIAGEIAGFFLIEARDGGEIYWHLAALAPTWRDRGIGPLLWESMLWRHRQEGALVVETTVSGHNLPVLNLYAKLGFTFTGAQMTFHWLASPILPT
jgi:ribosomal protein S18 acetylase RimI-like enzyme